VSVVWGDGGKAVLGFKFIWACKILEVKNALPQSVYYVQRYGICSVAKQ
jgi:hypothetical protein